MPNKPKNLAPKVDIDAWTESNDQIHRRLDSLHEMVLPLKLRVDFMESKTAFYLLFARRSTQDICIK